MRTAWLRWRELTVGERLTLLEALFLMPLAGILLRLFRYQAVLSSLRRVTPVRKRRSGRWTKDETRRMGELVNIAAWRGAYEATCLRRSMVLWWMLRRRGIDSSVRIGVRMEDDALLSHAWVEWEDTVLNDVPDVGERYKVIM